jgi:hypothetical protein
VIFKGEIWQLRFVFDVSSAAFFVLRKQFPRKNSACLWSRNFRYRFLKNPLLIPNLSQSNVNVKKCPQMLFFEEFLYYEYSHICTDSQLLSNVQGFKPQCCATLMFLMRATRHPYFILLCSIIPIILAKSLPPNCVFRLYFCKVSFNSIVS